MADVAIKADGLGKRYRIGGRERAHRNFREAVMDAIAAPARRIASIIRRPPPEEMIWALRDVSFEVNRGEVVGVIGRNGAGKTTLLRILSRITKPTEGRAEIRGRVGSLLEVGTGFHPELTGQENIFLNGSILGMRRREIRAKFDEIVAFAEIERFIDTPVKRYSSGMQVRLAFAVAAHLEPEILLVDEVLAVGDAQFQKKCLGKMGDVAKEGRTVLFVSHNMGAVQQLCRRAMLVEDGQVRAQSDTVSVVGQYLQERHCNSSVGPLPDQTEHLTIRGIRIEDSPGLGFNSPIRLNLDLECRRALRLASFGLGIANSLGARVLTGERTIELIPRGRHLLSLTLSEPRLPPGQYQLTLGIDMTGQSIFFARDVVQFGLSDIGIDDPYLARKRDRIGVFLHCDYDLRTLATMT